MQTRSSPNLQTLHRLAQQSSIDGYESMSKETLFRQLQEKCDMERLMRTEARARRIEELNEAKKRKAEETTPHSSSSSSSSTSAPPPRKKLKLNKIDPIMFTPIGKAKCFKFHRPNGTVIRFSIEPLVDYLLTSGDFSDPETRIPFSDEDLKEIDSIVTKAGLQRRSVLAAKNDVHGYSEAKFRRDALLGLERCAGEVVTEMLQIIETSDPDDAQMQLVMREFPTFLDYYRQLKEADAEYAGKCIKHWRQFLRGPPNRPNIDDYGLLQVAGMFLKSCHEMDF